MSISFTQATESDADSYIAEISRKKLELDTKIYTNWINRNLSKIGIAVDDLSEDFKDGYILYELIKVLTGKKLGNLRHQTMQPRMIDNFERCFTALKKENVNFLNVDKFDLSVGNLKVIVPFIYSLWVHFEVKAIEKAEFLFDFLDDNLDPPPNDNNEEIKQDLHPTNPEKPADSVLDDRGMSQNEDKPTFVEINPIPSELPTQSVESSEVPPLIVSDKVLPPNSIQPPLFTSLSQENISPSSIDTTSPKSQPKPSIIVKEASGVESGLQLDSFSVPNSTSPSKQILISQESISIATNLPTTSLVDPISQSMPTLTIQEDTVIPSDSKFLHVLPVPSPPKRILTSQQSSSTNVDFSCISVPKATPNKVKNILMSQESISAPSDSKPQAKIIPPATSQPKPVSPSQKKSPTQPIKDTQKAQPVVVKTPIISRKKTDVKFQIINACNKIVQRYGLKVDDINSSCKDGKVLIALLNFLDPEYVDYNARCNDNPKDLIQLSINIAQEKLGIISVFEAQDFDNPKFPDAGPLAFLSGILIEITRNMDKSREEGKKVIPPTITKSLRVLDEKPAEQKISITISSTNQDINFGKKTITPRSISALFDQYIDSSFSDPPEADTNEKLFDYSLTDIPTYNISEKIHIDYIDITPSCDIAVPIPRSVPLLSMSVESTECHKTMLTLETLHTSILKSSPSSQPPNNQEESTEETIVLDNKPNIGIVFEPIGKMSIAQTDYLNDVKQPEEIDQIVKASPIPTVTIICLSNHLTDDTISHQKLQKKQNFYFTLPNNYPHIGYFSEIMSDSHSIPLKTKQTSLGKKFEISKKRPKSKNIIIASLPNNGHEIIRKSESNLHKDFEIHSVPTKVNPNYLFITESTHTDPPVMVEKTIPEEVEPSPKSQITNITVCHNKFPHNSSLKMESCGKEQLDSLMICKIISSPAIAHVILQNSSVLPSAENKAVFVSYKGQSRSCMYSKIYSKWQFLSVITIDNPLKISKYYESFSSFVSEEDVTSLEAQKHIKDLSHQQSYSIHCHPYMPKNCVFFKSYGKEQLEKYILFENYNTRTITTIKGRPESKIVPTANVRNLISTIMNHPRECITCRNTSKEQHYSIVTIDYQKDKIFLTESICEKTMSNNGLSYVFKTLNPNPNTKKTYLLSYATGKVQNSDLNITPINSRNSVYFGIESRETSLESLIKSEKTRGKSQRFSTTLPFEIKVMPYNYRKPIYCKNYSKSRDSSIILPNMPTSYKTISKKNKNVSIRANSRTYQINASEKEFVKSEIKTITTIPNFERRSVLIEEICFEKPVGVIYRISTLEVPRKADKKREKAKTLFIASGNILVPQSMDKRISFPDPSLLSNSSSSYQIQSIDIIVPKSVFFKKEIISTFVDPYSNAINRKMSAIKTTTLRSNLNERFEDFNQIVWCLINDWSWMNNFQIFLREKIAEAKTLKESLEKRKISDSKKQLKEELNYIATLIESSFEKREEEHQRCDTFEDSIFSNYAKIGQVVEFKLKKSDLVENWETIFDLIHSYHRGVCEKIQKKKIEKYNYRNLFLKMNIWRSMLTQYEEVLKQNPKFMEFQKLSTNFNNFEANSLKLVGHFKDTSFNVEELENMLRELRHHYEKIKIVMNPPRGIEWGFLAEVEQSDKISPVLARISQKILDSLSSIKTPKSSLELTNSYFILKNVKSEYESFKAKMDKYKGRYFPALDNLSKHLEIQIQSVESCLESHSSLFPVLDECKRTIHKVSVVRDQIAFDLSDSLAFFQSILCVMQVTESMNIKKKMDSIKKKSSTLKAEFEKISKFPYIDKEFVLKYENKLYASVNKLLEEFKTASKYIRLYKNFESLHAEFTNTILDISAYVSESPSRIAEIKNSMFDNYNKNLTTVYKNKNLSKQSVINLKLQLLSFSCSFDKICIQNNIQDPKAKLLFEEISGGLSCHYVKYRNSFVEESRCYQFYSKMPEFNLRLDNLENKFIQTLLKLESFKLLCESYSSIHLRSYQIVTILNNVEKIVTYFKQRLVTEYEEITDIIKNEWETLEKYQDFYSPKLNSIERRISEINSTAQKSCIVVKKLLSNIEFITECKILKSEKNLYSQRYLRLSVYYRILLRRVIRSSNNDLTNLESKITINDFYALHEVILDETKRYSKYLKPFAGSRNLMIHKIPSINSLDSFKNHIKHLIQWQHTSSYQITCFQEWMFSDSDSKEKMMLFQELLFEIKENREYCNYLSDCLKNVDFLVGTSRKDKISKYQGKLKSLQKYIKDEFKHLTDIISSHQTIVTACSEGHEIDKILLTINNLMQYFSEENAKADEKFTYASLKKINTFTNRIEKLKKKYDTFAKGFTKKSKSTKESMLETFTKNLDELDKNFQITVEKANKKYYENCLFKRINEEHAWITNRIIACKSPLFTNSALFWCFCSVVTSLEMKERESIIFTLFSDMKKLIDQKIGGYEIISLEYSDLSEKLNKLKKVHDSSDSSHGGDIYYHDLMLFYENCKFNMDLSDIFIKNYANRNTDDISIEEVGEKNSKFHTFFLRSLKLNAKIKIQYEDEKFKNLHKLIEESLERHSSNDAFLSNNAKSKSLENEIKYITNWVNKLSEKIKSVSESTISDTNIFSQVLTVKFLKSIYDYLVQNHISRVKKVSTSLIGDNTKIKPIHDEHLIIEAHKNVIENTRSLETSFQHLDTNLELILQGYELRSELMVWDWILETLSFSHTVDSLNDDIINITKMIGIFGQKIKFFDYFFNKHLPQIESSFAKEKNVELKEFFIKITNHFKEMYTSIVNTRKYLMNKLLFCQASNDTANYRTHLISNYLKNLKRNQHLHLLNSLITNKDHFKSKYEKMITDFKARHLPSSVSYASIICEDETCRDNWQISVDFVAKTIQMCLEEFATLPEDLENNYSYSKQLKFDIMTLQYDVLKTWTDSLSVEYKTLNISPRPEESFVKNAELSKFSETYGQLMEKWNNLEDLFKKSMINLQYQHGFYFDISLLVHLFLSCAFNSKIIRSTELPSTLSECNTYLSTAAEKKNNFESQKNILNELKNKHLSSLKNDEEKYKNFIKLFQQTENLINDNFKDLMTFYEALKNEFDILSYHHKFSSFKKCMNNFLKSLNSIQGTSSSNKDSEKTKICKYVQNLIKYETFSKIPEQIENKITTSSQKNIILRDNKERNRPEERACFTILDRLFGENNTESSHIIYSDFAWVKITKRQKKDLKNIEIREGFIVSIFDSSICLFDFTPLIKMVQKPRQIFDSKIYSYEIYEPSKHKNLVYIEFEKGKNLYLEFDGETSAEKFINHLKSSKLL